jgi:uncharacterized protein (DUF433 family)
MAINPLAVRFRKLANTFFPVYHSAMSKVVFQDAEIIGGEPVFRGTRVPVKSLFDHLEAGDSIEDFLGGFPSVAREQVIALLEEAKAHAQALS